MLRSGIRGRAMRPYGRCSQRGKVHHSAVVSPSYLYHTTACIRVPSYMRPLHAQRDGMLSTETTSETTAATGSDSPSQVAPISQTLPHETPAWLQRAMAVDARQEKEERDALPTLMGRLAEFLHAERARPQKEGPAQPVTPMDSASQRRVSPLTFAPAVSVGGSVLSTALTWVLEAQDMGRRLEGGRTPSVAAPVVVFESASALTSAMEGQHVHEVPRDFATRYSRASEEEQKSMWNDFYAQRSASRALSGSRRGRPTGQPEVSAATTQPRRQRGKKSKKEPEPDHDTQSPPSQHVSDLRFHWRLGAPPMDEHIKGPHDDACATFVFMLPLTEPSLAGWRASTEEEMDPRSPVWVPQRLLSYLPHFPLPSSRALASVAAKAPRGGVGGMFPPSSHNRPPNLEEDKEARTSRITAALHTAAPDLLSAPQHASPSSHRALAADQRGGEVALSALCSTPSLPSVLTPQLPRPSFTAEIPSQNVFFRGPGGAARSSLSPQSSVPLPLKDLLRRRWSRYWRASVRPEDLTAGDTYFFPYQAFSFLDRVSRERLRTASSGFNSRHSASGAHRPGEAPSVPQQVAAKKAALHMTTAVVRGQAVRLLGEAYVNGADTVFSALLDGQTCVRHGVPLDETGQIFYAAMSAVRQVNQKNLRDDSRLMRFIADRLRRGTPHWGFRHRGSVEKMHAGNGQTPSNPPSPELTGPDGNRTAWHSEGPHKLWLGNDAQLAWARERKACHRESTESPRLHWLSTDMDVTEEELSRLARLEAAATRKTRYSDHRAIPSRTRNPTRQRARRDGKPEVLDYHLAIRRAARLVQSAQEEQQPFSSAPSLPPPDTLSAAACELTERQLPTESTTEALNAEGKSPDGVVASPWITRLRSEDASTVAGVMGRYSTRRERFSAMKGTMAEYALVFRSPYWIATDTLEERWGVSAVPNAVTISVAGRTYVNAEQTLDASRFNPHTCAPRRIHEVLTMDGLYTCAWELSASLRVHALHHLNQRENTRKPQEGNTTPSLLLHLPAKSDHGRRDDAWHPMRGLTTGKKKSFDDVHNEADDAARCDNFWVELDLVQQAGWTLRENAVRVHVPVRDLRPMTRTSVALPMSSSSSFSSAAVSAEDPVSTPLRTDVEMSPAHADLGTQCDGISEHKLCVYAADIAERDEIVYVLQYSPMVVYAHVEPVRAGSHESSLDDGSASPRAQASQPPQSLSASGEGTEAVHALVARRAAGQSLEQRRLRSRRYWRLPVASRIQLALYSLRRRKTSAHATETAGRPRPPGIRTSVPESELWLTSDGLHAARSFLPTTDDASVPAVQVTVEEPTATPTRIETTSGALPQGTRPPSRFRRSTLTLVRAEDVAPSAGEEALRRTFLKDRSWLFCQL